MVYTGGELNELNGKMGISAPFKSVPVMKLIKVHSPKSKEELVNLIEYHYRNNCSCGIVSTGTVEDFGKKLYESQMKYWGKYRYTLEECIQWEFDLFVVQSLKGGEMEKKAIQFLTNVMPTFSFEEANGYFDEELRIDIIIRKNGVEIAGIQVKPLTFSLMRKEVVYFQGKANKKWGKSVLFLYYDNQLSFTNLDQITREISILD